MVPRRAKYQQCFWINIMFYLIDWDLMLLLTHGISYITTHNWGEEEREQCKLSVVGQDSELTIKTKKCFGPLAREQSHQRHE